jgi:DNA-directed RNA polymerase, beta subunit/140 kD subunit
VQELPSLIEVQLQSFDWFVREGLAELFDEINPIESYNGNLKLYFPGTSRESKELGLTYWFDEPKHTEEICLERDMSYAGAAAYPASRWSTKRSMRSPPPISTSAISRS